MNKIFRVNVKRFILYPFFFYLIFFLHSSSYPAAITLKTIKVSISDTVASNGSVINIPVIVDDLTDLDVTAFSINIRYDSTILKWNEPIRGGTISAGLGGVDNGNYSIINEGGRYVANIGKINGASASAVSGDGVFIFLNFIVLNKPLGTSTNIMIEEIKLQSSTYGTYPANISNGKFLIAQKIVTTVEKGVDSINFSFSDNSKIKIQLTSGSITGRTINVTDYGYHTPVGYKNLENFDSVIGYYEIVSDVKESFEAKLTFSYTNNLSGKSGINEEDLIIAKYNFNSSLWEPCITNKDTVNNIMYVNINSFSIWALTDRKEPLLKWESNFKLITYNVFFNYTNQANLMWQSNLEILGFEIQRSLDNIEFENIGYVKGGGTSSSNLEYEFIDNNLKSNKYYYRLKQIYFDGSYEYSNALIFELPVPTTHKLNNAYPNPFNSGTVIGFEIAQADHVLLKIYDVSGREIINLIDEFKPYGYYSVKWDGKNKYGIPISSGVYICVLRIGEFMSAKKLTIVR